MTSPQKAAHLKLSNFLMLFIGPLLLISLFWLICIGITSTGLPLPKFNIEKFLELGYFCLTVFGIIVFFTLMPFQMVEANLSPIFYAKIFNSPASHFGNYVLMWSFLLCFSVVTFQHVIGTGEYLNQLFISLIAAIIFAVLFQYFWGLRCICQPYIVNKYLHTLKGNKSNDEIWLQLFECAFKAVKQVRVSEAKNYVELMAPIYDQCDNEQKEMVLREDLLSLYQAAKELRPVTRSIEQQWPFVLGEIEEEETNAMYSV